MFVDPIPDLEVVHCGYGGGSGRVDGDRGDCSRRWDGGGGGGGGRRRDSVAVLFEAVAGVLAEAYPPVVHVIVIVISSTIRVTA